MWLLTMRVVVQTALHLSQWEAPLTFCSTVVVCFLFLSDFGSMVQTTAAGGVSWEVVEEQAATSAPKEKKKKKQMTVKVPKWCGKWVVGMDNFKEGVVGAKSKNIAGDPCQAVPQATHIHYCQYSTELLFRYQSAPAAKQCRDESDCLHVKY